MGGPSSSVTTTSTPEIPSYGLEEWARLLARCLGAGDRIITLFGRREGDDDVMATAVLEGAGGCLLLLRGRGRSDSSYPALTPKFPAVQMFERELWEQTGLTPEGHPWLKPVRYEGSRQQRMGEHPFFQVRGEDVHEVGVGPIHAGVIEPGHFRFMCHGEEVYHLELQLGYQHRGVEAALLRRDPRTMTTLVESIVGDSSIAYAWGYCSAVEALAAGTASDGSDMVAGIALELERIAMHLATLAGLTTDLAFLQGSAGYGRLRTSVINATMRVCGSRFGRGWLRPGGARYGITDDQRRDLLATLEALSRDLNEVNDLVVSARSVTNRLRGVGRVTRQAAVDLGLVGVVARASGVPLDTRVGQPGRLYWAQPVSLVTEEDGDCWARMRVRMREVDESLRWLRSALGEPDLRAEPHAVGALQPNTVCVSVCEGVRGPVVQVIETGGDGRLAHYKVQDPSLVNWFGLAIAVRGNEISDFPICNKSFDLSYCGNDL